MTTQESSESAALSSITFYNVVEFKQMRHPLAIYP